VAADHVALMTGDSAVVGNMESRHDNDVILPVQEMTDVDNVGSDGSVRENE